MQSFIGEIGAAPLLFGAGERALAEQLFAGLKAMSFDGVGISRETYGPGETQAMALIETAAKQHGLETCWDAARTLIVRLPGAAPELPVAATGSHVDSVPEGGNYDGAAGVIAGLMTLIAAKRLGGRQRTLELYVLRGEESAWYGGPCYFGSRALFGQLEASDFASARRGSDVTLGAAMAACGADMAALTAGAPLLRPEHFQAWIELHIEQGPVLVAKAKPVGIVTGIRGNVRHRRVVCRGEAAHSGAVPRWLRHDAVLAMAELLMRIDEHWRVLLEWGEDLVVTSGIVETNPREHAVSRVPGEVSFALEYRSQDAKTLQSFGALIRSECDQIGAKRGVAFDLGPALPTKPAKMSEDLVERAAAVAAAKAIPAEIMPSGAGHDTAVFANAGVPATMIFVRNEHGSHNPNEAMDMADFFLGAEVLGQTLLDIAGQPEGDRP